MHAHHVILDLIQGHDQTVKSASEHNADLRPPLVVIAGPTASGKSGAAIALARALPVEVINADSRSFYRGMDIGTAKVSRADRDVVPHHLIDILDPRDPMSLATFQGLAMDAIALVHRHGRIPLLVGGTPQYVNAVVEGWTIPEVPPNDAFRQHLERAAGQLGVERLSARLREVDPESADRAGRNLRRIIRAIEIYEATGTPMSALQGRRPVSFDPLELELWLPRDQLHERIDRRVDHMMALGLVEEVRSLLNDGVPSTAPALSSIGYRQVLPLLEGTATESDVIGQIKRDTHRLVRHQQTWFRKNERLIRIDVSDQECMRRLQHLVQQHCGPWLATTMTRP